MSKRNKIIVSIVGITIVLLALLGITYAYYLTRIEGNTNTNSISITTADLKLVYGDGNGLVTKENVMPGTIIEKIFTVTNSGNSKIDNYAVYLEEVINTLSRTGDLTYVLECSSSGEECNGGSGEFPQLAGIVVTNSIEQNVTHTYKLTVTYEYFDDEDQSEDMGSNISALVQIYALKDVVDISGTVSGIEDGDYAQINSVQKKSQIVDGKYVFVGVKPGTHTIKICGKADITCDSPKFTNEIVVNLGTSSSISGNVITITEEMQSANIAIDVTNTSIKASVNPFDYNSLAYKVLNNAMNASVSDEQTLHYAKYRETPTTTVAVEVNKSTEADLSVTPDDFTESTGINSYYFRGNVENNYVTFADMCWRIVRIKGNQNIKLVLEDQDSTCEEMSTMVSKSYSYNRDKGNFDIAEGFYGDKLVGNYGFPDYLNYQGTDGMANIFKEYQKTLAMKIDSNLTEFSTLEEINDTLASKLEKGDWCNIENVRYDTDGVTSLTETQVNTKIQNSEPFYYDVSARYKTTPYNPTLKCNGYLMDSFADDTPMYVATLTYDEIIYSGLIHNTSNNHYWCYLLNDYWDFGINNSNYIDWVTLSPTNFNGSWTNIYIMTQYGRFSSNSLSTVDREATKDTLRPAISLNSSGVKVLSGDGTMANPYVIQ